MRKTNDKSANPLKEFQLECKAYLFTLGIGDLRAYGREIGVARPTTKNKDDLIEDIVSILSGKLAPITVSKLGAPIKNDHVDERIPAKIKEIKRAHSFTAPKEPLEEEAIRFNAPIEERIINRNISNTSAVGQIVAFEEGYYVVPLNYNKKSEMVLVDDDFIKTLELREGDIVEFYARLLPGEEMIVDHISKVNHQPIATSIRRPNFEDTPIATSIKRIRLFDEKRYIATSLKYLEWLLPLTMGKRGCIIAPHKAGKTKLLLQIAEAASVLNPELEVYVLLLEQSPETIEAFKNKVLEERVFYTTYDDDSDRNVLLADFLLNRLKRKAESGKDVLLIVDSLSILVRAYNDMEEAVMGKTLSNGLREKTVRYLRKYFGSARCLKNFGSIAILGGVNQGTENPWEDAVCAEISSLANYEIRLSGDLARKHIFPAIDFGDSTVRDYEILQSAEEQKIDRLIRGMLLPNAGAEGLLELLVNSSNYQDFIAQLSK